MCVFAFFTSSLSRNDNVKVFCAIPPLRTPIPPSCRHHLIRSLTIKDSHLPGIVPNPSYRNVLHDCHANELKLKRQWTMQHDVTNVCLSKISALQIHMLIEIKDAKCVCVCVCVFRFKQCLKLKVLSDEYMLIRFCFLFVFGTPTRKQKAEPAMGLFWFT